MSGIIGRFFLQFGLHGRVCTIFSIVVSYTIVPMLAGASSSPEAKADNGGRARFTERIGKKWDAFYDAMAVGYRSVLAHFLHHRARYIGSSFSFSFGSLFLFRFVRRRVHTAHRFRTWPWSRIELPPGTSLERTREVATRIEDVLKRHARSRASS